MLAPTDSGVDLISDDVTKLYIMLYSFPLPTDTFIKSNVFKKLVLDKTSEKLINKDVVATRGEGQTELNGAPLEVVPLGRTNLFCCCIFACTNEII